VSAVSHNRRMAKKRKPPEDKMPAQAAHKTKNSTKDRHKPRKMLPLPPRLYEQLVALAGQNSRPVNWEGRRIIEQALRDAGLWPPPPEESE
jgi:hypothetical protein